MEEAPDGSSSPGAWNPGRVALRGQLAARSGLCADLYGHAVDLLGLPVTRANLVMLGHAVRELVSELTRVLAEEEGKVPPRRSDPSAPSRKLADEWEAELRSPDDGADVVPITRGAYVAATSVVRAARTATENAKARDAMLIASDNHALVGSTRVVFRQASEFFMDFTHVDRAINRTTPSRDDIDRHFATVERVIRTRAGRIFDPLEEVDALLAEANAKTDE